MIFAYTLEKLLSGQKKQTRRLVKHGEVFDSTQGRVYSTRTVYQIGKTYAVQPGRTQPAVARIRLSGIRRESVDAISEDDARAEGYASRMDFLTVWRDIHGKTTDTKREVWVLEFELIDSAE